MSNPKHQELLHHNQPSSLSKEDTPPPHGHACDYDDALEDVFSVPPKTPRNPTYQKWKRATLVLNASHRFRYATDLKGCENRLHHLRTTAHAVRAARRFLQLTINKDTRGSLENHALDLASESSLQRFDAPETELTPASREAHLCITIPSNGYVSLPDQMACLVQERNPGALEELGGVKGIACVLEVSFENGLKDDTQYIQERRDKFGPNTYPPQPSKPFLSFVFDACKDLKLSSLMVCSIGFGIKSYGIKEGFHDGMSIAFAVMLVILVTSIRDYWQSLQFLYLSKEKRNISVHVIRGGRKMKVSIFELVVGDLVSLGAGDQVPADGLFVDGHSLLLDESSMTGESEPVDIDHKRPYLLSGCKVADGYGTMLITGVGIRTTEWGHVMAELGEDSGGEETPLQVRLNGLATFVRKIGLSIAVLVLLILVVLYVTGHRDGANNTGKFRPGHTPNSIIMNSIIDILARASIGDILAMAITLMIVAVPDGLSVAFTLSLAYAMKKMIADRALVRRLAACETMGSATTICTDKTGTLTLNIMTVVKVCVGSDELRDVENLSHISSNLNSLLLEGIAQNSSASVFVPPEGGDPEVMGSPTEKACLMWGLSMAMNFNQVRSLSKIQQVETFNSIKKRACVAVKVVNSGKLHVHSKGAAEIVLEECNSLMSADDSILPMTAVKKKELMNVIEEMASQSLQCIAFAYKEVLTEVPSGEQLDVWKGPLTLIAIFGIKDPCRPGVQEAVHQCKAAGIKVRMLTGDNLATAKAIATECGILEEGGIAIEGVTFRNYSDEMRRNELPKISVMACSLPSDKLLMVRTLREMGEVVAVTGDGNNDAPALREADIGLAMGIQGTEVAKESSDIIILDDNFATIVKVVRWGRSVYVNIQRCIQFQLTVNVAASTMNFILPVVASGDVPLTAVQMLWVNLIMDTLGALALSTEPPTDELLKRPPVGRKETLISNIMLRNLLLQAFYQIVVLLTFQFRGKHLLNLDGPNAKDINYTVIFNTFVLCQLFNVLNARKLEELNIFKGLFQHGLFMGIIASTLVLQVVLVEFLNKFASTVKLSWNCWVTCIVIGFLSWPIAFMGKSMLAPIEGWEGSGKEKGKGKGTGKGEKKKEKGAAQKRKRNPHGWVE